MTPVLKHDQIVIVARYKQYGAGEVVVIHHNGIDKIKRISQSVADRVFVLGDNQTESTDSRQFGWLTQKQIIGKVVWPLNLQGARS